MKKIFFALLLIASILSVKQAGAQLIKFYYYPNTNVYYDVTQRQYIYADNGNWVTVAALPTGIRVVNTRRVVVYNPTPQVWIQNPGHIKKYKTHYIHYPNGKAVGYKGTNPNKANGKLKPKRH